MAEFGPSSVGAVLQGIGAIAQAAAIFAAAWFASNTFNGWRKQKLSERRIEQAERILIATYKARRALSTIRSPSLAGQELYEARLLISNQSQWLEKWDDLDASKQERLVIQQVRYSRLNANLKEPLAVEDCLPMARALFGQSIERALKELLTQFHMVKIAADADSGEGNVSTHSRELREILSFSVGDDGPNDMDNRIEQLVTEIESVLLPFLRLDG